jgi:hypothetical protein
MAKKMEETAIMEAEMHRTEIIDQRRETWDLMAIITT